MRKRKPFLIWTMFFCVAFFGCGYTLHSNLPARLKTVYVVNFKNQGEHFSSSHQGVYFPLIEIDVHNAIVDYFLLDGRLKPLGSPNADLVIRGVLKSYDRKVLRRIDNDDAEEYRVYVTLSIEVWDTDDRVVLWQDDNFLGESTYFVSGSQASTEKSAVDRAVKDLARRVVERTIENW